MFVEDAILLSFAVTVVTEIAIVLFIQRSRKIWQWALGVLLVNALTHPWAIYFLRIRNADYVLVEAGVFVAEALLYRLVFNTSWRRSMALSGAANIASIVAGVVVRAALGI